MQEKESAKGVPSVENRSPEEITCSWWVALNDARKPPRKIKHNPFNSGDSAELRRCKTLDEIVLNSQAFHTLRKQLSGTSLSHEKSIENLALVAGVLSHLRQGASDSLPKVLAGGAASDPATVLRFQRTIQYKTPNEIFRPMLRLVTYLEKSGKGVSVAALAKDLYDWNDETRKKWAIEFYETMFGTKEKEKS